MNPLPAIALTLGAYLLGVFVNRAAGGSSLIHPVVVAMAVVLAFLGALRAFGHPLADAYLEGNAFLVECLMVGIVAFCVPLIDNARQMLRDLVSTIVSTAASAIAIGTTTIAICLLFGLDEGAVSAAGLRSVTTPMAVAIAEANAISIELAMLGVFVTGVLGVVIGQKLLEWVGVTDERHVGLMFGITCHAFGVIRALEISTLAAAYATVGMIVTGVLYAFCVPWVIVLLG